MTYKVIGLMSGSSLDGLDIAYVHLTFSAGRWSHELIAAECAEYTSEWSDALAGASTLSGLELALLDSRYGHYTGQRVAEFIRRHDLEHKVDFIASHGHTVFHEPARQMTLQIGNGAAIAAGTGFPVISGLREMDVAHGGQGAPIVPIGDRLLFSGHAALLNLGGIANITIRNGEDVLAFDVCTANRMLNALAGRAGRSFDENGDLAAAGELSIDHLIALNRQDYFRLPPPKSLSNNQADELALPLTRDTECSVGDLLHTACAHIAEQVGGALHDHYAGEGGTMLVTGGGAFNSTLVQMIAREAAHRNITLVQPDAATVQYKEAIVMALIGALRWREEPNVLASVTGSEKDSIGGALWMPA